jgi:hypothetical protein
VVKPGRKATLPGSLQTALEAVMGKSVAHVHIIEHSLYARLHPRAVATTRRRRIYLRGAARDFFADPRLVLHEYCHALEQWDTGDLTVLRYGVEWLRHGYWNNRFEVAARAFADRHAQALRDLANAPRVSAEQGLAPVEPPGGEYQQRSDHQRRADR